MYYNNGIIKLNYNEILENCPTLRLVCLTFKVCTLARQVIPLRQEFAYDHMA